MRNFIKSMVFVVGCFSLALAQESDITVHGFMSQGYLYTNANNYLSTLSKGGMTGYNELGLNFSKQVDDNLRLGMQLFGRDMSNVGNGAVVVDWAQGDYQFNDQLGIRVGKIKTPAGFFNSGRDVDMLRTQALLPTSVYPESLRDIVFAYEGVGIYGNVDVPGGDFGNIEYDVYGGALDGEDKPFVRNLMLRTTLTTYQKLKAYGDAGILASYGTSYYGQTGFNNIPNVSLINSAADVFFAEGFAIRYNTPIQGLRLGYSNMIADAKFKANILAQDGLASTANSKIIANTTTFKVDRNSYYSAEYSAGDLMLVAEYWDTSIPSNMTLGISALANTTTQQFNYGGYYGGATYRLNPLVTLGCSYGEFYNDITDKEGKNVPAGQSDYSNWMKDWTVTSRFDISPFWIVKAEAHFVDGTGLVYNIDNTTGRDRYWNMYVIKSTFNF